MDASQQVLPPLDSDFFLQAQRLDESEYTGAVREAIAFAREEYGLTRLPTLEAMFTQLEAFEQFQKSFRIGPGRRPLAYQRQLENLLEAIVTVFAAAFDGQECNWHDRIAHALRRGDAIISFNYDTLIDDSVRRHCQGLWKANKGYGFSVRDADGAAAWSAERGSGPFPAKNFLRLLKPHGSLHWAEIEAAKKRLRLQGDPYASVSAAGSIIPPTWDKTILGGWPWKPVWEEASRVLEKTRCLIVVGYSVPQTDLTTQALIRSALRRTRLRLLVVANPDAASRARVIDLARGAIYRTTRVVEFNSLQEFADLLDETPRQRRARQATARQLRTAQTRIRDLRDEVEELDQRTDALDTVDIQELETQVEGLSELEPRVNSLEELEQRVAALEETIEE